MSGTILLNRTPESNARILNLAEPRFTTDTLKLLIGNGTVNQLINGFLPNVQSGTTYTFVQSDTFKFVLFTSGSAVAATLSQPTASSFTNGWTIFVQAKSAAVTITPTSCTINGASSYVVASGQGAIVISDGTNYQVFTAGGAGVSAWQFGSTQQTLSTTAPTDGQILENIGGVWSGMTFPFGTPGGRLTLLSGTPVPTQDVVSSTTPTLVQTVSANNSSGATATANWSKATTSGNLAVAVVEAGSNASRPSISAGSAGWTAGQQVQISGSNYETVSVFYILSVGLRSGTETFNLSPSGPGRVTLLEVNAPNATWTLDKQNTHTGSGLAPDSGTTATTTISAEAWIAAFVQDGTATFSAPTNSFTLQDQAHLPSLATGGTATKFVASTGAADCSVTSGISAAWGGSIQTFGATFPGSGTIYYVPYVHDRLPIYDGTRWQVYTIPNSLSVAMGTLSSGTAYDVFAYLSSGVVTLFIGPAWSGQNARGTGAGTTQISQLNGLWVNTVALSGGPAATQGTYLGTFYTASTTTTEDSVLKRFLFNAYNRVPRPLFTCPGYSPQSAITYTTASLTSVEANGGTGSKIQYVLGLAEDSIRYQAFGILQNSSANALTAIGVGEDVTSPQADISGVNCVNTGQNYAVSCGRTIYPASIGYHYLDLLLVVSAGTGTYLANVAPFSGSAIPYPYATYLLAEVRA